MTSSASFARGAERDAEAEMLLGRPQRLQDMASARAALAGKVVMVTGAGGSVGGELCRQLLRCAPRKLVLFEAGEFALFEILREIGGGPTEIVARLGSVTDGRRLRQVIAQEGVACLLHAAAYKHVALAEANPLAAIENNVFGTRLAAEAARDQGVESFVLVSTDKATRPTSLMGATKRLAELVMLDMARRPAATRFAAVRFGNVLGSSGSVVPLFREQIARGGPVTLTDPLATRYFMTIPEAAQLVLLAAAHAAGGGLYMLDMGEPVAISDLARRMIAAAGREGRIGIEIIGLRPGEKRHEDLPGLAPPGATPHPQVLACAEPGLSELEAAAMLRDLRAALDAGCAATARAAAFRWLPGASVAAASRGGSGRLQAM